MEIYNTLTRKKELLEPRKDKKVQMFVCGPTVYDYIHIGNARTFVFFDVVAKYLIYKGFDVDYIQNITDIDNKIIERAQKENSDPLEYAKKYNDSFKQDMLALGVTSPKYKNATDHIPEVIKQVQILLHKNSAYIIENDGIYFDLSTFPDYGKLSGRTASMADDAVSRIDDSNKKRNRGDFAIWKFSQDGDPAWSLETGKYMGTVDSAAPAFAKASAGWHIEDTAITEKYFGPQYDIHGGGQDLIFPHHEAEIAQQESASGFKPFVKYWMHIAFLVNKEVKMSKSLGNFETVNQLLKKYSKETLRFYLLSGYYRQPLEFNNDILNQSEAAINRISEFYQKLKKADGPESKESDGYFQEAKDQFFKAMSNDFNTPEALASVFEIIRKTNPLLTTNQMSKNQADKISRLVEEINKTFGIVKKIPAEIQKLVVKIEELREEKKFNEADQIRDKLLNKGYRVSSTNVGTTVTNIIPENKEYEEQIN